MAIRLHRNLFRSIFFLSRLGVNLCNDSIDVGFGIKVFQDGNCVDGFIIGDTSR